MEDFPETVNFVEMLSNVPDNGTEANVGAFVFGGMSNCVWAWANPHSCRLTITYLLGDCGSGTTPTPKYSSGSCSCFSICGFLYCASNQCYKYIYLVASHSCMHIELLSRRGHAGLRFPTT
jgi:hypothetical protein